MTAPGVTPANLPVWDQASLTERIARVLAEARDPSRQEDPEFFDRKAEVFDQIAAQDELVAQLGGCNSTLARHKVDEALRAAATARRRAAELRTGRS